MSNEMEQIVKHLNEDFPGAEFSYGHLDNWYPGFDPEKDGCYYLFTQIPLKGEMYKEIPRRFKYTFGNGTSAKHVEATKSDSFLRWIDQAVNAMDSEEFDWWHRRIHRNDCPQCGERNYTVGSRMRFGRYEDVCNCLFCGSQYKKVA